MNLYAHVLRAFGIILMLFSLTMLVPLLWAWFSGDGAHNSYSEAFGITFLVSLLLWFRYRHMRRELQVRDGFLIVVMVWTLLPAFATLPLILHLDISFTDAYFETVSGLTTTGATVISGLDQLPQSINLWRHMLIWLGAMGLIVLAVAVLPMLGIGGRAMFKAETPGPMKDSKMTPRIAQTAKGLWSVYFGLTLVCALALRWAGMDWFDAICHTFSTMGLGGFSTHDASFGYFNSAKIEGVTVVFMLIAGMNFSTLYLALMKRSLMPYARDPEAPWFLAVTLGSAVLVAIYLWGSGYYPSEDIALRYALFHVVSIATTTGYASVDYGQWPMFLSLWMLLMSSFVTSAGSTGGGIKMIRALLLYKQLYRELMRAMHPSAVYNVRICGNVMPQSVLFAVLSFAFVYMISVISLTLLMSFTGLDIVTSATAVFASINNTGPGLGLVGPSGTFAVLSDFQTWVCSFTMLLGRLELFTLLVVLTPAFWRK